MSLSKSSLLNTGFQPRKTGNCPNMTEKLLIGMLSINAYEHFVNSTNITHSGRK